MRSKALLSLGLLLIVLGSLSLILGGLAYRHQMRGFVVDGVAQALAWGSIPLPPALGGLAVAGGIALLMISRR